VTLSTEPIDYRALCEELTNRLQHAITFPHADSYYGENRDAIDRARAALAQPEPEGVTDEELLRLACEKLGYEYTPALLNCPVEVTGCLEALPEELVAFARYALIRWGRPTIKPVPVAERLPGPEDCDAEGRCWWESPKRTRIVFDMNPLDEEEVTTPPAYYLRKRHPLEDPNQRWLPHHALPVPGAEVRT
jgi:hypothetical protein